MSSSVSVEPYSHREILVVLTGLMAGIFLAALDQTIVATALPTIVSELGGLDRYSWIVTAYLLSATVVTPLYGKVSDIYGRRITFQTAIGIFLLGSVGAALAPGMGALVAARAVQGVGAGGVMALTFAVVGDIVSPRQRGRYIGYLAGVWACASVVGPLLGGLIVDIADWRWVFWINLPVGLVAMAIIAAVLRVPVSHSTARVDAVGAGILVAGISLLLLALVWGGTVYPWWSATIVGLATAGAALTGLFLWWETRVAEPILPLRLFRNRIFSVSAVLNVLIGFALFGAVVFLPLFLQVVTGESPTNSGLLILPLTAGIVLGSVGSGRLTTYTGRYRVFPIVGSGLAVVGMGLLSSLTAEMSRLLSGLYMAGLGLGVGMVMQVSLLAIQNAVEHRDLGVATSAAQFFRSMGGSFGVAILGAVINARLLGELASRLSPASLEAVQGEVVMLLHQPAAMQALPAAVAGQVAASLEGAIQTAFLAAVPMMAIAFLVSWRLEEIPLRDTVGTVTPVLD